MLSSLHISNYVLIDRLDVDFPEGLVIISGPTGAGKSILIGALGLLTGAKADASAIAPSSDTCVIEGEFLCADESLKRLCEENDLEYDEGRFLVRRTVSRSGRSRAFINDVPVALPVLAAFGSHLVDIHSQHDTLLLTSRSYQLSILDSFSGNGELLSSCGAAWESLRRIRESIAELSARLATARSENDYYAAVYKQLCDASLKEGELAELESEQLRLANAGQIEELLSSCVESLSPSSDAEGVVSKLSVISRNLDRLAEYMPRSTEYHDRVESSRIELKDISDDLESLLGTLNSDPGRLDSVEERLSLIYGLMKRHGCSTETELIAKRDELARTVGGGENMEEELESLKGSLVIAEKEYADCADKLHASRMEHSAAFASEILSTLAFVELENASFEVRLSACEPGPGGTDQVEFLFAAGGQTPAPVAKCASGGELSRIMLSLKSLMSRHMNMPTMVFDEIDTGVSGSVADKMGSKICEMGGRMQVFAITHLPQVAAKGSAHYLVEKSVTDGQAVSTIKKLSGEQRVLEVARMLSGASLTPEAIANAKSLLA